METNLQCGSSASEIVYIFSLPENKGLIRNYLDPIPDVLFPIIWNYFLPHILPLNKLEFQKGLSCTLLNNYFMGRGQWVGLFANEPDNRQSFVNDISILYFYQKGMDEMMIGQLKSGMFFGLQGFCKKCCFACSGYGCAFLHKDLNVLAQSLLIICQGEKDLNECNNTF